MLIDVSPDQSMLDEGVAREVMNHIQKLRKGVSRAVEDLVQINIHGDFQVKILVLHHVYFLMNSLITILEWSVVV